MAELPRASKRAGSEGRAGTSKGPSGDAGRDHVLLSPNDGLAVDGFLVERLSGCRIHMGRWS